MIETDAMDERLTKALEEVPVVAIADDFALRVMHRLPARRSAHKFVDSPRVGRRFGFAALAVLALAMFGLVPLAGGSYRQAITAVEWVLCAEFAGLTLWLSPVSQMFER